MGANFSEFIFLVNYKWKRFEVDAKIMLAKYGADFKGDTISYGSNIYLSTGNYQKDILVGEVSSGRPSDFGIKMLQGNLTKINFQSLNFAYIINPYTNFKINVGVTIRDSNSSEGQLKHKFINFGIISDLFNHYYDI